MRRTTVLLAAAATAVLALPLPASAVRTPVRSAQVSYTGPTLTSVKLSTAAVSVKGLDTVPVTVTVTATGDHGPCPGDAGGVSFRRTSTHVWDRSATRSLIRDGNSPPFTRLTAAATGPAAAASCPLVPPR